MGFVLPSLIKMRHLTQEASLLRLSLATTWMVFQACNNLDGVPSIESKPVGVGSADQIILKNETGPPAVTLSMGFTVSNNIIAVEDNVGGGQETIYRVHPTYYVACYRSIKLGQLVDAGIVIGPVEVKYEGGARKAKVAATKDASGNYHLNVVPL